MKCFTISLFFTLMMESNMWLAYSQEHQVASDDNYEPYNKPIRHKILNYTTTNRWESDLPFSMRRKSLEKLDDQLSVFFILITTLRWFGNF